MRRFACALVFVAGCGAKVHVDPMPMDQDDPSAGAPMERVTPEAAAPSVVAPARLAPPGTGARTMTVARASVNAAIDAGPGAFLRGFEVAPVMEGDKFAGWRLVRVLEGEHRFDGLDVAAGDVLVDVNGMPVSEPDQLAALFESLRGAHEIVCNLVRGSARFQLRVAISETPGTPVPPRP